MSDEEQGRLLEEAIKKVKDQGFYMKRAIVRVLTLFWPFFREKLGGREVTDRLCGW